MSQAGTLISNLVSIPVTYLELGDVASVNTGDQLNREGLASSGKYPVMNGGIAPSGFYEEFNTVGPVTVISQGGASAGYVNWMAGALWAGAHCFVIKPKEEILDSRFLYHFLKHSETKIQSLKSGAGIPGLNRSKLIKLKCPVPSLEIQSEIVRTLDAFTELEAELESELEARKVQYEIYRDHLIQDDSIQGKEVSLGNYVQKVDRINWRENPELELDYVDLSSVDRDNKAIVSTTKVTATTAPSRAQQLIKERDVLFGSTRPTLNRLCLVPKEFDGQVASTGFCVLRADLNKMLPNYLLHLLNSSSFRLFVSENQEGASYPSISDGSIKSFTFKLPNLQEQERVSSLLDKFLGLLIDVNSGLPAEITVRRQQYEYYRNKLMSFKELEAV